MDGLSPGRTLALDAMGDGLGSAATVLRANAAAAGLGAPVPTCPGWTVLDLVAHQGMVHRWATSHLRGAPVKDTVALETEGRGSQDVLGWFDEGATDLLQAIVDAPDDLDAAVFLLEAPAPKLFWARRQCHETTVHAVDALAARLGRPPTPAETWVSRDVALDGIDELLRGFVPRRRPGDRPDTPTTLLVSPDDADLAWRIEMSPDRAPVATVERGDADDASVDAHLEGSAVELYLRLWSRGSAPPADPVEAWWRERVTVSW